MDELRKVPGAEPPEEHARAGLAGIRPDAAACRTAGSHVVLCGLNGQLIEAPRATSGGAGA